MRVQTVVVLSVVLLLSTGVATAVAAKQKFGASQQLCQSFGGTFSTKASSSYFRPFYKKQGVLWTCNSYTGGSASSQALQQSCYSTDGGQWWNSLDSGVATCWKNAPL